MTVVVGPCLDALGLAQRRELYQPPARPAAPFAAVGVLPLPELRTRSWATPATELRRIQPVSHLNYSHEPPNIGDVVWLQRDEAQRCWAVCTTDHDVDGDREWYYSVETDADPDGRDVEITGLGLVRATAQTGLFPVCVLPGRLDDYHAPSARHNLGYAGDVLAAAAEHHHYPWRRARGESLIVHDPGRSAGERQVVAQLRQAPAGPIEYRSAEPVDVSPSRRRIDLLVMPYERPARVPHEGRMIEEICSRGAFNDIDRQGNRICCNRDHDRARVIGKAVRFDPRHPDGLLAEIRVAATDLGNESLALAAEGILDASAGFAVGPGGQQWETRDRRRLTRCWLDHIALTPSPAYPDAVVLGVRNAQLARA